MRGKNVNAKKVLPKRKAASTRIPAAIGIHRVAGRKKSHRG